MLIAHIEWNVVGCTTYNVLYSQKTMPSQNYTINFIVVFLPWVLNSATKKVASFGNVFVLVLFRSDVYILLHLTGMPLAKRCFLRWNVLKIVHVAASVVHYVLFVHHYYLIYNCVKYCVPFVSVESDLMAFDVTLSLDSMERKFLMLYSRVCHANKDKRLRLEKANAKWKIH